ncbi:hypothetical protein BDV93DRAFT_572128 [Ceratobasidium sp. AG-I]|nr:hypothetical protein BDV93DRAFT_572128 [Ceratobasidium sp. AG-I]
MGNTRQKARRLQAKKKDAAVAAKKVVLKIPAPAKKGSIKKEDLSIDIELSDAADDDEAEEFDSLFDSYSDEYPEVDEAQKEGSEESVDGEDELDGDQDELLEEAPVAAASDDYVPITYLVPKDGSNTFKPLELSNGRSWETFKRGVAKIMGVNRDELSVSWRFNSAKSTDPFQSLDSGDEYRAMRTAFVTAYKKARKGSAPLSIRIKSQIDPPKPTAGSGRGKAGSKLKSAPPPEADGAPPQVWQIIGKLPVLSILRRLAMLPTMALTTSSPLLISLLGPPSL